MEFIGQVENIRKAYTRKARLMMVTDYIYGYVWLSQKGKLAVAYQQAKEHANWLTMGEKNPHQHLN